MTLSSKTALVVPCYNEYNRLPVQDLLQAMEHMPLLDFYFVNDGSTDDTLLRLEELKRAMPQQVYVVDLAENGGKANAVFMGMHAASEGDYAYTGYWDADGATPWDTVLLFADYMDRHADCNMVSGSRVARLGANIDRKAYRHYGGRVVATLISTILKLTVYDTQCGAKLFRHHMVKPLFDKPFITKWLFDVELFARIILLVGYDGIQKAVYEYPLPKWTDVGESKLNWKDMLRVPSNLYQINEAYGHRLQKLRDGKKDTTTA